VIVIIQHLLNVKHGHNAPPQLRAMRTLSSRFEKTLRN